jgi:hypothetical protein
MFWSFSLSIQSLVVRIIMKSIFIISLSFGLIYCQKPDVFSTSLAISQVIQSEAENVNIIFGGAETNRILKIVSNIRRDTPEIPTEIITSKKSTEIIDRIAVFLFESFETYLEVTLTSGESIFRNRFDVIFIDGLTEGQLRSIPNELLEQFDSNKVINMLKNQYFLTDNDEFLILSTFETFKQPNCSDWFVTELNRFSKTKKTMEKWKFQGGKVQKLQWM